MGHGANDVVPLLVEAETVEAVRDFIGGYLEPHARRIRGWFGAHPARRSGADCRWIKEKKVREFGARDSGGTGGRAGEGTVSRPYRPNAAER